MRKRCPGVATLLEHAPAGVLVERSESVEVSVGTWLAFQRSEPEACWELAAQACAHAVRGSGLHALDREELAADMLLLCMTNECAVLRAAPSATSLIAWLRGVAFNLSRRRRQREQTLQRVLSRVGYALHATQHTLGPCSDARPGPVEACERAEAKQQMWAVVQSMEPRCARIADLRLAGYSRSEITRILAQEWGSPAAMTRQLWRRTTRLLRGKTRNR